MLSFLPSTSAHRVFSFSHRRHLSKVTLPTLSAAHSIYVSQSTNPYFNLTLEDWLFRNKAHTEPLLLIYRDKPCVILGRNQNPWAEVHMIALRGANIPFIRRRSGGGTVYHDLGNTNFSIHLPRTSFDRHATAQVVLRAVRSLNIDANVNDRNDICVGSYKMSSAYKIVSNRAYHHGTMLISTQLDTLGDVLHVKKDGMKTKGVASVRSPVKNLREFQPQLTHDAFVDAMVRAFQEEYGVDEPVYQVHDDAVIVKNTGIDNGMKQLPSWDWAYGQTPEFEYTLSKQFSWGEVRATIHSKHGKILSCALEHADPRIAKDLQNFGQLLKGYRYGFIELCKPSGNGPGADVWLWLEEEMRA